MNIITLLAFFIIVFGSFVALDISPEDIMDDIFNYIENKDDNIGKKIKSANENKKDKYLVSLIKETKTVLENTNKVDKFSKVCIGAIAFMILGVFVATAIGNYYLVPILAIGFLTIPFQYVKLTSMEYKKSITQELEVSLSIITSSYIRSENIIQAVEENIEQIKPPIRKIFEKFLIETQYISSDIAKALNNLKVKIDDDIFHEWVEILISCQENIALKNTLSPTVSKLSSLRTLSAEINNNLYAPLKEFIIMIFLVYGNIPLLYVLNKDWYKTLMYTTVGKIVLTIVVLVTFISFAGIMKLIKPIEPSMLEEGE